MGKSNKPEPMDISLYHAFANLEDARQALKVNILCLIRLMRNRKGLKVKAKVASEQAFED